MSIINRLIEIELDVEEPQDVELQTDEAEGVELVVGEAINRLPAIPYDGAYEVTPLAETQVILPTFGKYMEGDVTVLEIPYAETPFV